MSWWCMKVTCLWQTLKMTSEDCGHPDVLRIAYLSVTGVKDNLQKTRGHPGILMKPQASACPRKPMSMKSSPLPTFYWILFFDHPVCSINPSMHFSTFHTIPLPCPFRSADHNPCHLPPTTLPHFPWGQWVHSCLKSSTKSQISWLFDKSRPPDWWSLVVQ
jgi:hypothetical protein